MLLAVLVHAAHGGVGVVVFFWEIYDEGAHSDSGGSDANCILYSFASDAGWIDNTSFLHIDDTLVWRHNINALPVFGVLDFVEQGGAIKTGIFHDMDKWSLECIFENCTTSIIVFEVLGEVDEGDATARNDAFVEGGLGGSYGIVDAIFLFVDFGFGGTTYLDDGNVAIECSGALIEFASFII